MKTVIWKGSEREIPTQGIAKPGEAMTLPDYMADSFVEQGLAKLKSKPIKKEEK